MNHAATNTTFSATESSVRQVISVVMTVIVFIAANTAYLLDAHDELKEEAQGLISVIDAMHTTGKEASESLQQFSHRQCDSEHLSHMQAAQRHDPFIKSITFHGDSSSCSTNEIASTEPTVSLINKDGSQLSFIPYANGTKGFDSYSIRFGNYELEYATQIVPTLAPKQYQLEVIVDAFDRPVHIAGMGDLYQPNTVSGLHWLFSDNFSANYCSKTVRLCVAFAIPREEFFPDLILIFMFNGLLAIAAGWLARKHTVRQQFKKREVSIRIKQGLQNKNFYFLFQPVIDMPSQNIIGCEVLARFRDQYGDIYPDQFIPLLPEHGMTWDFTEYLLEHAFEQLNASNEIDENFKVNINVFPQDIANNNISRLLHNRFYQSARFKLEIEITEDQQLESESAQENLTALSEQGISIAIDDFGTGYSNLKQIQNTHVTTLKIDRSFVFDLEVGAIRSSLIPNIKEIADKANLKIVAEGIENRQQYEALHELGIEYGQGWLFGKPMPLAEFLVKKSAS